MQEKQLARVKSVHKQDSGAGMLKWRIINMDDEMSVQFPAR